MNATVNNSNNSSNNTGGGGDNGYYNSNNNNNNGNDNLLDPPSMAKVKANHSELQELLNNLPNKLNKLSNQVDKEFLSSYRVHMLSIQTELKNLKYDVTKGEQLLNSDATVAKLETEAKWFSGNDLSTLCSCFLSRYPLFFLLDECGRLRLHHDAMFKDCEHMRERLRAMNEQKVFLSEQLKALMKRNKILQVAHHPSPHSFLTPFLHLRRRSIRSL